MSYVSELLVHVLKGTEKTQVLAGQGEVQRATGLTLGEERSHLIVEGRLVEFFAVGPKHVANNDCLVGRLERSQHNLLGLGVPSSERLKREE